MRIGIENGLVVAYNGKEHRLLEAGTVVIEDDRIVHVGESFSGNLACARKYRRQN